MKAPWNRIFSLGQGTYRIQINSSAPKFDHKIIIKYQHFHHKSTYKTKQIILPKTQPTATTPNQKLPPESPNLLPVGNNLFKGTPPPLPGPHPATTDTINIPSNHTEITSIETDTLQSSAKLHNHHHTGKLLTWNIDAMASPSAKQLAPRQSVLDRIFAKSSSLSQFQFIQ